MSSLRVNLDMGKTVYAQQIMNDNEIPNTIVRTSTLPEELGRIEYLLSDKTGTLTQNGELYVKFKTTDPEGKDIELIRKVDTTQKVSNTAGFVSKRYVVKEKVKLGKIEREILINLNDRGRMDYRFLVGRNLLLGRFIVDVARSHVLGD